MPHIDIDIDAMTALSQIPIDLHRLLASHPQRADGVESPGAPFPDALLSASACMC